MDISSNTELQPLSAKEIIFVEEYLSNGFNKAKAARTAKYSKNSDRQIGWEIYNKPHVKAYIEKVLKERVLTSSENIKLINDIALSNLTDYYVPVKVIKAKKIKVGLQVVIDSVQDEIDFEDEYRSQVEMTEEVNNSWFAQQEARRDRIIRYKIELKRNPKATRIIEDEKELVTEMRLDMNLLVADKERGKVKSITYGKDGLKVEMYPADAAQERIAKMHGDYKKDNEQKPVFIERRIKVEIVPPLPDDE